MMKFYEVIIGSFGWAMLGLFAVLVCGYVGWFKVFGSFRRRGHVEEV